MHLMIGMLHKNLIQIQQIKNGWIFAKAAWNGAIDQALAVVVRDAVSNWRQVEEINKFKI